VCAGKKNMKKHPLNRTAFRLNLATLLLGITFLTTPLVAQIGPPLPGIGTDYLLETQSEIDALVGNLGVIIDGNIIVSDNGSDPISNLDALAPLILVLGNITVTDNSELDRFCGLYPLLSISGLFGTYTVSGNLENPTTNDILAGGECPEPEEEILTLEEILQAFVDDGVLNKGRANSLAKQAKRSLKGMIGHLMGFVNAGILTEDEALLIFDAAIFEQA